MQDLKFYTWIKLALMLVHKTLGSVDITVPCSFCCPYLFSPNQGIINVRESSSVGHTISFIARCFLSIEEIIVVSDGATKRPYWLNWNRYKNDKTRKRVCTYIENVPISYISTEDFLQSSVGYFQQLVTTYSPDRPLNSPDGQPPRRTNFIFIGETDEEMVSLVEKVSGAIQVLRTGRNNFWQPYFIFLWGHVLNIYRECESSFCKESPGKRHLKSWLADSPPSFTLDSGIFFFFMVQRGNSMRSKVNLHISVWECYKIKGEQFVMQEVKENRLLSSKPTEIEAKNENCKNTSRTANPQVMWMEQINYYFLLTRFSRRTDFQHVRIRASTEEKSDTEAFIRVRKNNDGSITLLSGSATSIIMDLELLLNFKTRVNFGDGVALRANVSGLDLSADILLDQKSVTPTRQGFYSFLQPTSYGMYNAFFVQPKADSLRNLVSAPFTAGLWAIVMTTWFSLIGCLYGWAYIYKRYSAQLNDDKTIIQEVGLWAIAAMSQKAWPISPSSLNYKAIYIIVYLMAYICYVAYSAAIVSFLTVKLLPVKTMQDLVDNQFKFTAHNASEATIQLVEVIIETYDVAQKVIRISTENEITHLISGKRALVSYPDLFYRTASNQKYPQGYICNTFDSIPVGNTLYKSAMSVKKASQYKEMFSVKLITIMERGLNHRYTKVYEMTQNINCPKKTYENTKRQVDPVHLTDVFTTYIVIIIGWVAAITLFFTERLYKRRRTIYDLIFFTH